MSILDIDSMLPEDHLLKWIKNQVNFGKRFVKGVLSNIFLYNTKSLLMRPMSMSSNFIYCFYIRSHIEMAIIQIKLKIFCEFSDFNTVHLRGFQLHPFVLIKPTIAAGVSEFASPFEPFFCCDYGNISLMTAAAAMVPCTILAHSGAGPVKTETAIPVNTRETPE